MLRNSLNKVAVTGIGVITPVGIGKREFWHSITAGKSGISRITRFDITDFPVKSAGEVKKFRGEDYVEKKDSKNLPLSVLYAVAAGRLALEDAGLSPDFYESSRFGIFAGNGAGGFETAETAVKRSIEKNTHRLSPYFIPYFLPNMAAGVMSINLGIKGPVMTCASACAAGSNAIGEAYLRILHGEMDAVVAGGTESVITPVFMAGLNSMKALSKNEDFKSASRPFDKNRDGFVMGEGAGFLILENMEKAEKRGIIPIAEIAGYSILSEGWHIAAPEPEGKGMAAVMELALKNSGIEKKEIGYINAHGTSTKLNDRLETLAIKKVFGSHSNKIKVSSTKSMTGHLLGSAGAVEAAATVLAVKENIAPPTINLESPDPHCDLNYVPNTSIKTEINCGMSNSFGFGGVNTSLIFKKYR